MVRFGSFCAKGTGRGPWICIPHYPRHRLTLSSLIVVILVKLLKRIGISNSAQLMPSHLAPKRGHLIPNKLREFRNWAHLIKDFSTTVPLCRPASSTELYIGGNSLTDY
ncbi:hypothetical protein TNIN_240731 [Trichonephila inaurata madagascariensis]|uniref:Uncharacterized protein n=1 Tax=Trichonephila inaurata madagascariensis TaxID=2747483 RepID=A0A8X6M8T2_9ARAC|nr:hypothetical protein TNIN_240731 [Trichonephila inaurata madagascariensis]